MTIPYMILTFVTIFLIIMLAGRLAKKIPSKIVKAINWTSFFFAAVSGLLLYMGAAIISHAVLIPVFTLSLIVYFIFLNYDRTSEEK